MVLVAIAMVAIIAMAALSIDVITLYLAREESQRSADAAALAAARIISLSGITGDPANKSLLWTNICGPSGIATQAAQAVAMQNAVGGPAPTVTVTYGAGNGSSMSSNTDCGSLATSTAFGVNPIVTVKVGQNSLPTFFSRVWGTTGNSVSATASAEAFNPSNSGTAGNAPPTGTVIPVQPRCVKPWAVPNQDPLHNNSGAVGICTGGSAGPSGCAKIINLADGSIVNPGISLNGSGTGGIIGETFWLSPVCRHGQSSCNMRISTPQANYNNGSGYMQGPPNAPNLVFAPGQVGTPVKAVPSCSNGDQIEEAIGGCDSPQNYSCGVSPSSGGTNGVDLSTNPDADIANGVSCFINQSPGWDTTQPTGQDYLSPFGAPGAFPFQILAGNSSSLSGSPITSSPSVVSLPIYDETSVTLQSGQTAQVTFVGFLQVFVNAVDQFGNVYVTILNVVGCGNNATGTAVAGTSPVPIRLITPP